MIQAVIQAGGQGTRLISVTKNKIPKPMVEILGKPLLQWQIENLKKHGVNEFIIVVGYLGEAIVDYFGDGKKFGVYIKYIVENKLLGTAGCFYYLKQHLKSENFIFVYADVLFDIYVSRMLNFHIEKNSKATLFVHPNSHPYDSDLVVLDSDQKVKRIDSKNNIRDYWYKNMVNAGFFIFHKSICDFVKNPEPIAIEKDLICPLLEKDFPIYGYSSTEYIKDAGTIDRLQKVSDELKIGRVKNRNLKYKQKCIFLDRDGTINKLNGLIDDVDKFTMEEFAIEGVKRINESEYLAIVVTNQPVIAKGKCLPQEVEYIHNKMDTLLGKSGAFLDDIIYCPHHPEKGYLDENPLYKIECNCRKPEIGMIQEMTNKYNIDISKSWIIGDTTVDLQTGKNAGLHTCLLMTGEAGNDNKYDVDPDFIAVDLLEAVNKIIIKDKS